MKVKCIWPGPWKSDGVGPRGDFPSEGAIYTVVKTYEDFDGKWFVLAEYDDDTLFAQKRFRCLDEVDRLADLVAGVRTGELVR